jgi:hypothetical protein
MRNKFWQDTLTKERAEWAKERKELLDRIQHPEIKPVEPGEQMEYETPKDEAELAQVGQIVPEFVNVGENGAT